MLKCLNVKAARGLTESHQVDGGKVAGGIVEKHIFRTRIACANLAGLWAGMPFIDRGVKLDAGVCTFPGCLANLVPKLTCGKSFGDITIGAPYQVPRCISFNRIQKVICNAHCVV